MKASFSIGPSKLMALAAIAALAQPCVRATSISLIANGSIAGTALDYSGLTGNLESGVAANLFGGVGSGLAWAGGDTFLGLPDRGPNATPWAGGATFDNTTTYIPRFQTLKLDLTPSGGALPFSLTPTLLGTTLLYSKSGLTYGSATPAISTSDKYYFSGRSDNFDAGLPSTNPNNARLDPEGIRVSPDGAKVYVTDEYGPYVYEFDRLTGERTKVFTLPSAFAVKNLSSQGALEISGNTSGRVANKGMEGLAISPDGKTLVGFEQSPLIQDGGDGERMNRIVTIDVSSGATKQYAYDNRVGSKNFNSSEILALNDHQFLVLERDGKGLGDGSSAAFKQIYLIDTTGAEDVSGLTGKAALLAKAVNKTLFLDLKAALNAAGITDDKIPAKLEGMSFGEDVTIGGVTTHTLFIANDNDFLATDASGKQNPNQWFVFGVSDAELSAFNATYVPERFTSVPDSPSSTLALMGFSCASLLMLRRRQLNGITAPQKANG